jgi:hypothetical protein
MGERDRRSSLERQQSALHDLPSTTDHPRTHHEDQKKDRYTDAEIVPIRPEREAQPDELECIA